MTKIYLIRHTQAEGNLYRMMQGHWDGDVTAQGIVQIEALSKRFESVPVDAVYSSDLYRARLTATAVTRSHALPLNTDIRLRELNIGPWEEQFFGNIFHDFPQEMELFMHDSGSWYIEGAETFEGVADRAYPALEEIAQRHNGESVVVVSHGVTIRCLLHKITGIPLSDTEALPICRNTAVSELRYENGAFIVDSYNDYTHLLSLPKPSWSNTASFRDESFDPLSDKEYYNDCYADAWRAAHGSVTGYRCDPYFSSALEHYKRDSGAVLKIFDGEESVGLIDLDTARGESEGYGWISLLYLKKEYRGQGMGVQLLARAIKHYKKLGRGFLRLHVAEDNTAAVAFYRSQGFTVLGEEKNALGKLLLMESDIGGKREDV